MADDICWMLRLQTRDARTAAFDASMPETIAAALEERGAKIHGGIGGFDRRAPRKEQ
ncbi:hypothetical protein [Pukyongiella litopenaei]|uniref:hypothetical protein n=1 Tax=Pukyongiella litopenaei TaxID=2605946 RepID=UPI001B805EFA|nr:hypothetical protein [Pukyongiella litopenaei]